MASQTPIVTFTKPIVLEFGGNMFKNSITLGDVDNDGLNELIVGNDKGDLAIFKGGTNRKPVRFASELGFISCVAVGDLLNIGLNVLLVVTACGTCYIYDFLDDNLSESDVKKPLKYRHMQQLPANIKMALIGSIHSNTYCEMIVALTDRIVRSYKWVTSGNFIGNFPEGKLVGQNKWELSDQIGSIALNRSENMNSLLASQPGGACFTLNPLPDSDHNKSGKKKDASQVSIEAESLDSFPTCGSEKILTEISGNIELEDDHSFAQFKAAYSASYTSGSYFDSDYCTTTDSNAYVLASMDGVVTLVRDRKVVWKSILDQSLVSISQLLIPVKKQRISTNFSRFNDNNSETSDDERYQQSPLPCNTYSFSKTGTPARNISSAIGIATTPSTPSKMTIPIPNSKPKRLSNAMKYGQPMDAKIIACATDGKTFILNAHDGTYCQFNFHDSVCCYTSGFYGYDNTQRSSIVYVTYTNEIYLYYDVSTTLEYKPKLMDLLKSNLDYVEGVRKLGIDIEDRDAIRKLNSYLLDGYDCTG